MLLNIKFIEYGMKLVEMVLERACRIVTANEMQFGLMSDKGTIDAWFVSTRVQEEYCAWKKKLYVFLGPS